ncbi:MFS transporter [Phragmitibacter flavus]|uniref:MFS transporter n=1 Tax=Phragmitibacter flavus TaxID=2576071 RepID=A0A5R8K9D4_9BACT|nr:MFS transporter [Phragmitibacter flavus]TLD68901.1 MFS transporter [Phragmitibacter flavus]
MISSADAFDSKVLDEAEKLPPRNQLSYVTMLVTQGATAFTDNFVKMLMVAFAGAVALGTDIGDSMQVYLGIIFSIPYIIFSPVAGWMSDRYSKQRMMFWTLGMQTVGFVFFLGALSVGETQWTLWLSLGCFFLVATQSAFFSPAKFGILKELIGSRRLGSGSGMMQMLNLAGTLAGMWAGPTWFKHRLESGDDAWSAVWWPMLMMTGLSLIPMMMSLWIQRTPERRELKFDRSIWWEHVVNLKLIFKDRPIMLAALGGSYFWFLSNALGSILVTLSHELHPLDKAAASGAMAMMPAMLGVGIVVGSLLAGLISRKRIELGLVPLSGLVLSASLMVVGGFSEVSLLLHGGLILIGVAGGCFMAPLYAFVQDRAKPEERARVMASLNLMDCVAAIVVNLLVVKPMMMMGLSATTQILVLAPLTFLAAMYIMRILPRRFLHLVASWVIRLCYRVRAVNPDRLPLEGGVLVVPNHVSYADALMIGLACRRDVRFVMLDTLYHIKAITWGLKIFGTVPISSTKPREAIRTVSEALKAGQAVVLFAEGQLTRTGFVNELYKGFELMARVGGGAKVQPVWLDGLWGSLFSFDGGKFFKKMPKRFRHGIGVWFGELIEAGEVNPLRMREELSALGQQAFAQRVSRRKPLPGVDRVAWVNALRIIDTSLLNGIETVVCGFPREHVMGQTFGVALAEMKRLRVVWGLAGMGGLNADEVLVVDEAGGLKAGDFLGARVLGSMKVGGEVEAGEGVLPAMFDAESGTLLSLSVPHPPMPKGEEDLMHGWRPGGFGHVLNGLSVKVESDGVFVGGLGGDVNGEMRVKVMGMRLDDEGFFERMKDEG